MDQKNGHSRVNQNRENEIDPEHQHIHDRIDRAENRHQALDKSITDLTIQIQVMAEGFAQMQKTLSKLSSLWEDYHTVDKRVANIEQSIKAIQVVAGAVVVSIVGLAVTAIFGGGLGS